MSISRLRSYVPTILILLMLLSVEGLSFSAIDSLAADRLVVYSGRAERLIKPVLDAFQTKSGAHIDLLSSGSTELVNRLQAEGARTSADVFITNEVGALERARELKLLAPIEAALIEGKIPSEFRASDNSWIGLSGRIWLVVYNTSLVKPDDIHSILDLSDPRWKGKIAIPNAGSEYLQAGVSVIQATYGDPRTRQFLEGLKTNAGTRVYGKSSQIVDAVAKGEAAVGLVNHYYIFRHLDAQPKAPIAPLITDQQEGGMGAIVNAAGVGIVAHSRHKDLAKRLVEFLESPDGQKMFADQNKEYPLNPEVPADPALPNRHSFRTATVPLIKLGELREPTMALIERVGLR